MVRKICRAWSCVLSPRLLEEGNSENWGKLGKAAGVWVECPAPKATEGGVPSVALGRGRAGCPASKGEGGWSVQRQRAPRVEHSPRLPSAEGRIGAIGAPAGTSTLGSEGTRNCWPFFALRKTSPQERPMGLNAKLTTGTGTATAQGSCSRLLFCARTEAFQISANWTHYASDLDICACPSQCAAHFFLSFSVVRQDLRTAMRERPVACQSGRHPCHPTRRRTVLFLICTFAPQLHGQLRIFWREKKPLPRQSEIVADHSRHGSVCSFMLRNWEEVCVWVGLHICHCG